MIDFRDGSMRKTPRAKRPDDATKQTESQAKERA